jgi:folate-dependent phosphoribosylglycinamide formyltransferase PurN
MESFAAEAVIALHLPRSSLCGSLCAQYRHRMLASVPSLSPFVTGVEDADDMIGLVVRTGSKYTGCTVFRVVENQPTLAGLPTMWPVMAQEIVELESSETAKSLRRKVDGRDCLGKAFVESLKTIHTECRRFRAEAATSKGVIRSQGSYNHFVASFSNTDI